MRIAMLAPLTHRIPPAGYGPWERVVSDLTSGLIAAGHQVTLFAPEGSETDAELVATVPFPFADWPESELAPDQRVWEEIHIASMAEEVSAGGYDIVHSHLNVHALGFGGLLPAPMVTTLHGSAWNQAVHPALARYRTLPFISLSDSERSFYPGLNYVATVFNGVDCEEFRPGPGDGGFLLFAGRMAPEKQPDAAIAVARAAHMPLKLAGMVEARYRDYFDASVAPATKSAQIEYLGDLDRETMTELYAKASAVIMPLAWDEPFGLVVVESLASGTPVVGWRRGALPELVKNGVTGFIVEDVPGAVSALANLDQIDRRACRRDAEARFSVSVMTDGYVSAYGKVIFGAAEGHVISPSNSSTETVTNLTPSSAKP